MMNAISTDRAGGPAPRRTAAIAMAAVALLAVACGGSPGTSNGGGSTQAHSLTSQVLAFARCMRSHGVSSFPDPDSSGALPKTDVADLAVSNPEFPAARRACGHLLPNGGQPTRAQSQQAWNDMRDFAHCMRAHGVPSWPDPTETSPQDHRPFFNVPAGIDPDAPQITTRVNACRHVLHANNPLVTLQ
jgi:hypothetical protein